MSDYKYKTRGEPEPRKQKPTKQPELEQGVEHNR